MLRRLYGPHVVPILNLIQLTWNQTTTLAPDNYFARCDSQPKQYTALNGVVFSLRCAKSYNISPIEEYLDYVSFDQCMDTCAYNDQCVAINFRGKAAPFTCDLLGETSDAAIIDAYDSAVRI